MNTKKDAPTSAATLTGAAAEMTACRASIPISDCTTAETGRQRKVSEFLCQGQENAIKSSELARLAGLSNVRQLQAEIARERDAGAVILSTCRNGGGYYLPQSGEAGRQEIAEYMRTLRARALNTLRAIRSAQAALENVDGQVSIDV